MAEKKEETKTNDELANPTETPCYADCRSFSIVNGNAFPCGCTARFSSGGGAYSDVIYVELCEEHFLNGSPKEDAKAMGFSLRANGKWLQRRRKGEAQGCR